MTLKQGNHALNALAEELDAPEGMYAVRNEGPRVQDGVSYFHGIWADGRFETSLNNLREKAVK